MKKAAMLVAAMFVMLNGCGSDPVDPFEPFEPQISNATDSFQMQASDITDLGTIVQYSWVNTGAMASVDHSTTTVAGNAGVVIRDAGGAVVYNQNLAPSLNENTAAGSSGTWTIYVTLSEYSGTINFRVQKK